jgi:hypothetical protein
MEFMNSSKINDTHIMMVPMEEHYICENKASLCGGNHPTICAYTNVAHVGKEKKIFPHLTLTIKQIYPIHHLSIIKEDCY